MDSKMDDAAKFTLQVGVFILVALLLTLSIFLPRYQHEQPAAECKPFEYPICERATAPSPLPPPSLTATYLAIIATATLAILLIYASYHASVIEQTELVVAKVEQKTAKPEQKGELAAPTAQPSKGVDIKTVT